MSETRDITNKDPEQDIRSRKRLLRQRVKQIRKELSEKSLREMSRRIFERIVHLEQFKEAAVIFLYLDLPGEVQTRELIIHCLEAGKRVALPRVEESGMHFYGIDSFEHLTEGKMGILEPDPAFSPGLDHEEEAFLIMPGLAYDRSLNRIGYGGGCYDRYLEEHRRHPNMAVAFECQIFDEVPCDERDIRPQMLITERDCYNLTANRKRAGVLI